MNTLSQFLVDPRHVQLVAANHVLRYLKVSMDYGPKYDVNIKINLQDHVDSDWEGSVTDKKSIFYCCFNLGYGMISWFSRKQSCMAMITTEAEYVAACVAICEAIWLRKLLSDLFDLQLEATNIFCDNQSCMKLLQNPTFRENSKHIEIKYHYIRDMVPRGVVKLQYVAMDE